MIVEAFLEFEKHMKDLRSIADFFFQSYSTVLLKTLKVLFVETKMKCRQRVGDSINCFAIPTCCNHGILRETINLINQYLSVVR